MEESQDAWWAWLIPSISPKFCKFWPKFQENHSKSCKIQEFLHQELESSGFGSLHKLLLSFLEILKFWGTQFSVVHRRWIFFETANTRWRFCEIQGHKCLFSNSLIIREQNFQSDCWVWAMCIKLDTQWNIILCFHLATDWRGRFMSC